MEVPAFYHIVLITTSSICFQGTETMLGVEGLDPALWDSKGWPNFADSNMFKPWFGHIWCAWFSWELGEYHLSHICQDDVSVSSFHIWQLANLEVGSQQLLFGAFVLSLDYVDASQHPGCWLANNLGILQKPKTCTVRKNKVITTNTRTKHHSSTLLKHLKQPKTILK